MTVCKSLKSPDRILLGHGAGGRMSQSLVQDLFLPAFRNPQLEGLSDAAILDELPAGRPALTTDGFVVDPPVFPGGDLGYLSVCGTVNDLAVAGARPLYLTWAVILEEGLEGHLLQTLVEGARRAAEEAGVTLVAGDTKVVPRGKGDGAYATTAGLGIVPPGRDLGDHRVAVRDAIVVSGPLGDHGATVMACRHQIEAPELESDCAPLASLVACALESGAELHAMHDPTRGGLATTCNEVAVRAEKSLVLREEAIPIRPEVSAACDLLGLDPLHLACEGRVLFFVNGEHTDRLLAALRSHRLGRDAVPIGEVGPARGTAPVLLETRIGGERPLDLLSGSDLPRIC